KADGVTEVAERSPLFQRFRINQRQVPRIEVVDIHIVYWVALVFSFHESDQLSIRRKLDMLDGTIENALPVFLEGGKIIHDENALLELESAMIFDPGVVYTGKRDGQPLAVGTNRDRINPLLLRRGLDYFSCIQLNNLDFSIPI